jgi:hypothetical protein
MATANFEHFSTFIPLSPRAVADFLSTGAVDLFAAALALGSIFLAEDGRMGGKASIGPSLEFSSAREEAEVVCLLELLLKQVIV